MPFNKIIVSRNDAIGDMVLALPFCAMIKAYYPQSKVYMLGRTYAKPIAETSTFVDGYISQDAWKGKSDEETVSLLKSENADAIIFLRPDRQLAKLARQASIPNRVGTVYRIFHLTTCNSFVAFSRKRSLLHEAQLNMKLLEGIGINEIATLDAIPSLYGMNKIAALEKDTQLKLSTEKYNLIIHPKSHGNSLEWSLRNFSRLIECLDASRYRVFISGSPNEALTLKPWIESLPSHVVDISGTLTLEQFISFISQADGLIAASTGPVHIAAATGIDTLGLYTDIRTKEGFRWGPVGKNASYLQCKDADMDTITVEMVFNIVNKWSKQDR